MQKTKRSLKRLSNRRKTKGGCGCTKVWGGKKKMKGGFNDAFFTSSLSPDKYIPLNAYDVDQSRLSVSTRILPNIIGGKKTKKRRTKKQRGGNLLTPYSFETPDNSKLGAAMLTGNNSKIADSSIGSQYKGTGFPIV